jgi:hypothetical protein
VKDLLYVSSNSDRSSLRSWYYSYCCRGCLKNDVEKEAKRRRGDDDDKKGGGDGGYCGGGSSGLVPA